MNTATLSRHYSAKLRAMSDRELTAHLMTSRIVVSRIDKILETIVKLDCAETEVKAREDRAAMGGAK